MTADDYSISVFLTGALVTFAVWWGCAVVLGIVYAVKRLIG